MAYVVTQACQEGKYTKCVDVCPVEAFREGPDMLYIDPDVCIECNACLTECPVRAIYPQTDVPEDMREYIELNALNAKVFPIITESHDMDTPRSRPPVQEPDLAPVGSARRFAVVGAGPSGFYTTEEILKQLPQAEVDLFERLPTPYGLVRYGVAPDHPKIKSIAASFDKIARSPKVRFFGNVEIGKDVQRDELLQHYDAVLYATGGSVSRDFGLPGSDLANIHGASAFVGWYNGHPDYKDLQVDLSGETAIVVGMGNVALDIARILSMPVEELAKTDIADYALEALRQSRVRNVCLVARRGPVQAAFTPKELRQLIDMPGVNMVVNDDDLQLDADSAADLADPLNIEAQQNIALLRELQATPRSGERTVRLLFRTSPIDFEGAGGKVEFINSALNTLCRDEKGTVAAQATEMRVRLAADMVINATGYRGVPLPGVAFDRRRAVIANRDGRVLTEQGEFSGREYVAGWIKRGASGVVGSNKQCAVESVQHMLADLSERQSAMARHEDIGCLLAEREVAFVSFNDWLLLDQHERMQGAAQGRPRRKEVDVARMLEIIRDQRATGKAAVHCASMPKISPQPVHSDATGRAPAAEVKTHFRTCTLCESMCGIKIEHQGEKIISIAGDPDDPHSRGHICPKGYALQDLHNDPERLKTPIKRIGEQWIPISWDNALQEVAARLVEIQARHGNDAVGAYWGNPTSHNLGIMLTIGKFRKMLGTRNVFSASTLDQMPHQFVSYFMYGHSQLFTIPDLDRTDYMLMLGANPAASNGSLMSAGDVLGRLQAITKRGGKIVLIDPRRTETALYASEHQFIQPGTDALFLLGLIQVIVERRLSKPGRLLELAKGWDELPAVLNLIPLPRIAALTGIAQADIERIATEFAAAGKAVCYGRMGISTQEFGALNHWLIQLLNILTGNVDRAGGMMFTTPAIDLPKMSGRGSHARFRSRVRGIPEFNKELPAAVMAEEMLTPGQGQIRAFVTVAGNPVLSSPNGRQLDQALSQLDFMVSVDFYLNETTRHAHIILPPTGPFEHEQYDILFNLFAVRNVAKFAEPLFHPQESARSDWEIFNELIRRVERLKLIGAPLGKRISQRVKEMQAAWLTPERILDLGMRSGPYGAGLGLLSRLNPFAKKGLSLSELKKHPHGLDLGPLKPQMPGRLFTKDKKIQLMPPLLVQDLQRLRRRFDNDSAARAASPGLVLIGRRDLRTNNSWMHNSQRLVKGKDRCALFMHPADAAAHDVRDRERARLVSAVGELVVTVRITDDVKPGVVCLPHGWGHDRPGMRISTAQANPGISMNDVTDENALDELTGNAVLNGVPVRLYRLVEQDSAARGSGKAAERARQVHAA